jgi:two-component system, chemotaxis family, CheB/CheR fusion protein
MPSSLAYRETYPFQGPIMSALNNSGEHQRQLRSLFATLRTLVRYSREADDSMGDFAARLEGRIGALARVHEIMMRTSSDGVDLYELIWGELVSQVIPEHSFTVSGPEVRIARESAATLTLAFHELTVNALTHGAFSTSEGRTRIDWDVYSKGNGQDWLGIHWREFGTREAVRPTVEFSRELLEHMLPYELNAHTRLSQTHQELNVELEIPATASGINWQLLPVGT